MERLRENFEGFRLSPHQRVAWRRQLDNPAYQAGCALSLQGVVDVERLEGALRRIVARHEALRTTFRQPAWMALPLQVIADRAEVDLERVELAQGRNGRGEAAIDELLERSRSLAFDFESGPVARFTLLSSSPTEHLLSIALPALLADPCTLARLALEIGDAYAGTAGEGEEPIQYVQYSEWQNDLLEEEEAEQGREHWRSALATPALALPFEAGSAPRPAPGPFQPRAVALPLASGLAVELDQLCERQGVAPADLFLACWQLLLWRVSGQEELEVRRLFDGRKLDELHAGLGLFAKYLPVRVDFGADLRLDELWAEVGRAVEEGSLWQEHYTGDLAARDASGEEPIPPILFGYEERTAVRVLGGVRLSVRSQYHCVEPFRLRLWVVREAGELRCELHFDPRRCPPAAIRRLAARYEALLASVVRDPRARAGEVDLLSAAERHLVLREWSESVEERPEGDFLHHLFTARARAHPASPAVVAAGIELTYAELDERANRLAHHLVELGAGPDVRVGILLDRSVEQVVAILAVLKAGGAYLPLDAGQPDRRLALILKDARTTLVVTRERLRGRVAGGETGAVRAVCAVCVDADCAAIAARSAADPGIRLSPANLAYVIYTSGSTGAPKGVMISHGSLAHLPAALERSVGFGMEPLRVGVNAPISFDASVKQLAQISRGHCLFIVPEEIRADGWELLAFAAERRLDLLDVTPAQLRLLLEAGLGERPELRGARLLAGGEAIDRPLWESLLEPGPPEVVNVYGPTECTVDATACGIRSAGGGPAIGRPIANVQTYVLDGELRPVPSDSPGRLFVGGRGLARGYLGRPDLTAAKFVPHPFARRAGERIYDTGDRVRHRPDGRLEFLGRVDEQVKVRGFRVELGEIEAVLAGHPGVREAVVVVRRFDSGGDRLAAYWVGARRGAATATELLDHLRQRLPDYMLPAAFLELPALPLTRNGKVDRRALPEPVLTRLAAEAAFEAPRTPVEEMVAGIWSELLGHDRIGLEDDFFQLGGHSLLATQLISRIRRLFRIELPLRSLFDAPRLGALARAVAQALRGGEEEAAPAILPVPREGELPLSFAQRRLWFLDQLQPGNALYNLPGAVRLSGRLDLAALAGSLDEIVRRHEILRTAVRTRDGHGVQVILPAEPLALPQIDLAVVAEAARERELARLIEEDARRPFDLAAGSLLRVAIVRLGVEEHVLLLCRHHIASDAWATGILVRELAALYAALREGRSSPLVEPRIQYADYASWQRRWLQGEVLERVLGYWRRQLAGVPPVLDLPTDRPRSARPTYRGGVTDFALSAALTRELKALARRQGATPFMLLLAALQAHLFRLTRQRDLVVGTPVANRNRIETEGLIGFFVNVLAMRGRLTGDLPFLDLLAQAREAALEAQAHQDLPFEKLVEELQPERNLSHAPLFQVVLVLNNAPMEPLELPGLILAPVAAELELAKFDLTLALTETAEGFKASLAYSRDLFDPTTARRLADGFARLLAGAVASPQGRLASLALLSASEEHQVAFAWNDSATVAPRGACIQELIARQAERRPAALAVVFGERTLTYGELDERSNRIARRLRSLGVGPEVRVGVCMERSLDVVAALLGILKAGGAYLPLDPGYPEERLAFMIADGQVSVLLGEQAQLASLPAAGLPRLCLDRDEAAIRAECPEALPPAVDGDNLAYVMYTSGSTGRPKGVAIPHRAIAWFVATLGYVDPRPADRFAQGSTHSFDAATFEMWGALGHGARLVGLPKEVMISPPDLAARLREEGITVLYLTAALFMQTAGRFPDAFGSLRCLLIGGEVVEPGAFRRVLESGPPERLLHMYGPTETTVFSSWFEVREVAAGSATVSVGRSIDDARHHFLDGDLRPVPIGVHGEAFIGGDGLARGYLDRPDLTAERFVPDPFGAEPGARLYRTGDLMRFLADGRMEFGARVDNQVKIRGQRIELEEVEAVLAGHPAVRQAAVVVREDRPGDRRLVGYVVPRRPDGSEWRGVERELREHLGRKLPGFMVPAALVPLAGLPLTTSGKLDRAALPAPERQAHGARAYAAPRTETERRLAQLWAEVLGLATVGVEDDFFELGGHSLLATQLISRVREAFALEIPLRSLFEGPTVAQLAACVDAERGSGGEAAAPAIVPVPRERDLPLSFAQQRLWFLAQLEPGSVTYNIPLAISFTGRLDRVALARSLSEIVRRHEALRTVFRMAGEEPVQAILPPAPVRVPLADLSGLPSDPRREELQKLIGEAARQPFDLGAGPLLRASLFRSEEANHVLYLDLHHIAVDGWSVGLLVRELAALYRACAAGAPSPLRELPIQYADFACWQRRWLQGEALEAQRSYWKRQLGSRPPALNLPTDFPRPAVLSARGAKERLVLPAALALDLQALARREGVTLFMVLLAAFQTLLSRYAGQDDVSVGTPTAGRDRVETEELIGCFVNTLVLRGDLAGDPSFRELLARTREVSLEAHAHQYLPFEKVVAELQPERSLGHMTLFQVWFTLQNIPRQTLDLPGLELATLEIPGTTSKFDLNLSMQETAGELLAILEYSTDLFTAGTAHCLLRHLHNLLIDAEADPGRRLADLSLWSEVELRAALAERGPAADPGARCVHQLIADVAARIPHATAIVLGRREMSYGELDRQANQVARLLGGLGIGPGARVGIYLEHSLESVPALLGTLKAGASYVPLDPGQPSKLTELMARDSGVAIVLTQERLLPRLPEEGPRAIALDGEGSSVLRQDDGPVEIGVSSLHPAYVIYTSGSTGVPKGVEVAHGALLNYAVWAVEVYARGEEVTFPLYSSLSFDLTVTSIFPPLLSGNRIAVYPEDPSEPSVLAVLRDDRSEVVKLTPSHLALFQDQSPDSRIRRLVVGGEALTVELARRIHAALGGRAEILNEYGPTEATVGCMLYRFDPLHDRRTVVPIGAAAANTRIYLLDDRLHPVAENVTGLYIAGCGLAQGYVNRPDLTAERFLPDPFETGERMYRSGDLARRIPQGEIEYLGRRDRQVKYHGYRVELEGIRCALGEHAGVRDGVVVLARDARGNDALVAYYVSRQPLDPAELRAHLAERMLEETIPNLFVHLRRLPLTLNGKINYAALPSLAEIRGQRQRTGTTPRTPGEELLAGIWAGVLDLERVGIDESFFELGGHSLLAMQVVSRVHETFGVELPLRSLFETPTVSGLAARIAELAARGKSAPRPQLRRSGREGPYPLSFAQERVWVACQVDPGNFTYNVPVALRLGGPLHPGALQGSFAAAAVRHEILRTEFHAAEGGPVQVVRPPASWTLPLVDLAGLPEGGREPELRRLIAAEAWRPFDLAHGGLARTTLLRLGMDEHVLLLTLHHIVSDGWSLKVLLQEIMSLYEAGLEGVAPALPELHVQYGDFAAWQRLHLQGAGVELHLDYWRQRLGGAPPHLEVPTDRPRPPVQAFRGTTVHVALPAPLAREAKGLAQRERATLFLVLLAAFDVLLHHWTGEVDLLVGTDVAGRDQIETEPLIGFFINQLVLRADLSGAPSFREILRRVREATLDAHLHQDVPFARLVEELGVERDPSRSPLFQVQLNFQSFPAPKGRSWGLRMESLGFENQISKLDLLFALEDREEELTLAVVYDTALFTAPTIARLTRGYEVVLRQVIAAPEVRLEELLAELSRAENEHREAEERKLDSATTRLFGAVRRRTAGSSKDL